MHAECQGCTKPDRRPCVLVVEDDEVDIMALERAIRHAGYPFCWTIAESGSRAVAMLQEGRVPKPFVVLLDLRMPHMGGLELLAWLRAQPAYAETPVFVFTSSRDEGERAAAYRHHVAGYIVKTHERSQMLDIAEFFRDYLRMVELP